MHPDPETLTKLKEKGRLADRFEEKFGSLFQIELDALQLIPNYQKLITDEVDKLYKQDVRDEVLEPPEYSQEPDDIKEQIKEALRQLLEDL